MNPKDNFHLNDYLLHGIYFSFYGLFKYLPSPIGDLFRGLITKPFLKCCGKVRLYEGVTIWYPYRIKLGSRVTINEFCYLSGYGNLDIGDDVLIGHRVSIVSSDHIFEDTNKTIRSQGIRGKSVKISDDVWIGANSTILAGVTIGKGVIVAAGSVVTRDIPPFSIVGGVPAKILKKRIEKNSV